MSNPDSLLFRYLRNPGDFLQIYHDVLRTKDLVLVPQSKGGLLDRCEKWIVVGDAAETRELLLAMVGRLNDACGSVFSTGFIVVMGLVERTEIEGIIVAVVRPWAWEDPLDDIQSEREVRSTRLSTPYVVEQIPSLPTYGVQDISVSLTSFNMSFVVFMVRGPSIEHLPRSYPQYRVYLLRTTAHKTPSPIATGQRPQGRRAHCVEWMELNRFSLVDMRLCRP